MKFIDILLQIEKLNYGMQEYNSGIDAQECNSSCMSSVESADNEVKRIISNTSRMSSKTDNEKQSRNHSRAKSTLSEIIRRHVDPSINVNGESVDSFSQYPDDMPYLLIDVRNKVDFTKYHIHTAINHPHTTLTQSHTFETRELLSCRNREGTFIVLYDENESLASKMIEALLERGYENVYLLTGGLKEAVKKFPKGLLSGSAVTSQLPESTDKSDSKQGNNSISSYGSDCNNHGYLQGSPSPKSPTGITGNVVLERPIRIGFSQDSMDEFSKILREHYYDMTTNQSIGSRKWKRGSANSNNCCSKLSGGRSSNKWK